MDLWLTLAIWCRAKSSGATLTDRSAAGPVAGVIPIVFAQITEGAPGARIGLINTSRFSGNAAGPLLATLFFAHFSPLLLYGILAALTVASLAAFYRTPLTRVRPA